ncbi:MAG: phosphoribosyltransferase family protein [Minisyncoccia bacterium]
MHQIFTRILNLLFPEVCIGCEKAGCLLCEKCISLVPRSSETEYPFINALFSYRNPLIRELVWRFKYKNAKRVAQSFGKELYEGILGEIGDGLSVTKSEYFLLVPIPLHKKRERARGYNQSGLLCRAIIEYDTEKIFQLETKALVRTQNTKPQAKSEKRDARLENLRGAFIADKTIVKGKHIILIDDVTTTGATFSEARKVLLKAGAKSVSAWAVGH